MTNKDVIRALEEAVNNETSHDYWDDFLSYSIADPYLEEIRLRALEIARASVDEPGRDLSVSATNQLTEILHEVRTKKA
jgi:hypothetical protein